MLGLNLSTESNPSKYLEILGNFVVIFVAQLIFIAYGKALTTGAFPEPFEIYMMLLTALATTLTFFGINQARKPTSTTETT